MDTKQEDDRVKPLPPRGLEILTERQMNLESQRRQAVVLDTRVYGILAYIHQVIDRALECIGLDPDRHTRFRR